jgi:hypothetical protein
MPLIVKDGIDIETKYDSFHPNRIQIKFANFRIQKIAFEAFLANWLIASVKEPDGNNCYLVRTTGYALVLL